MICKNCGFQMAEGAAFCINCGAVAEDKKNGAFYTKDAGRSGEDQSQRSNYNSGKGDAFDNAPPYSNKNYAQPPNQNSYRRYSSPPYQNYAPQPPFNPGMNPPMENPEDYGKLPAASDYLKWILLGLIGLIPGGALVYIVLAFVFAFSKDNRARANFFKAQLIVILISLCISAVIILLCFVFMTNISKSIPDIINNFEQNYLMLNFAPYFGL